MHCVVIILSILIFVVTTAHGYNTKSLTKKIGNQIVTGGHEEITDWSHKIAVREGYGQYVGLSNLKDGTTAEDEMSTANALHVQRW